MDIKSRIVDILDKEDYTFSQLAQYLQMTEDGLTAELGNKTLLLRDLEAIAKALRVPLYSFFRAEGPSIDHGRHPYHMNRLWTGNDELKSVEQLKSEIQLMIQIITLKEKMVAKLLASA